MLTAHRRVPLSKLQHCRTMLSLPGDTRDRIRDFLDDFRVAVDPNRLHVLELAHWDPALAVSTLEHDFMVDERRVRRMFCFSIPHRRSMPLDEE